MQINFSFDNEFEKKWFQLEEQYLELLEVEGLKREQLDFTQLMASFYNEAKVIADKSIDSNSNVASKDVVVIKREVSKPYFKLNFLYMMWKKIKKLYGLNKANEFLEAQITGKIYCNDAYELLSYCFNFSAYDIALNGLSYEKKIKSFRPKHLKTFLQQVINFIAYASNHILGASGIADLWLVASCYVDNMLQNCSDCHVKFKNKKQVWKHVREEISKFIYNINQSLRIAESPFTNVSIYDKYFLNQLCPDYKIPDIGEAKPEIVDRIQKIFIDVMNEELKRTPITFPVTTCMISVDKDYNIRDEDFVDYIAEKNLPFGFMNMFFGDTGVISSCCRLKSEIKGEFQNSFGAGSSKIGSVGVVTINLPRLAYETKDKEKFKEELKKFVYFTGMINNARRMIVKKRIELGTLPLYSLGYIDLKKQYSTTGITGLNEALEILGINILEEEGQEFVIELMKEINDCLSEMDELYQYWHNVEQVPGESSCVKLAEKDRIIGYNKEYDLYSNQFIPLYKQCDLFDRIVIQGKFDKWFSGGSILHLNVEQQIKDKETMKDLINACAKSGCVYFAVNYLLGYCEKCSVFRTVSNLKENCEICGNKLDTYQRVVGFLTNTKHWNKTRREVELHQRIHYKI